MEPLGQKRRMDQHPRLLTVDADNEYAMIDRTAAKLGEPVRSGYFYSCSRTGDGGVGWILRLVKTGAEGARAPAWTSWRSASPMASVTSPISG